METEIQHNLLKLARAYLLIKKYIIYKGFSDEIDWQDTINFEKIDHQIFMREYAWVVLSSGMSDRIIQRVFPKIQDTFKNWKDLEYIKRHKEQVSHSSLAFFNNNLKIKAIIDTSLHLNSFGFSYVKKRIQNESIDYLRSFPYIGSTTCYHLAKNIGLSFSKPDRHLVRISNNLGYKSVSDLCNELSEYISEKVQVVDLVLWRYATLDKNYISKLSKLSL